MEAALTSLNAVTDPPSPTQRQGHLALLKRWYYRPEVRRTGEIFFPGDDGQWPVRLMLRGVGRIAASQFHPPAPRSAAAPPDPPSPR
jgi:excinuclease ABC subunit C